MNEINSNEKNVNRAIFAKMRKLAQLIRDIANELDEQQECDFIAKTQKFKKIQDEINKEFGFQTRGK